MKDESREIAVGSPDGKIYTVTDSRFFSGLEIGIARDLLHYTDLHLALTSFGGILVPTDPALAARNRAALERGRAEIQKRIDALEAGRP